MDIQRIESYMKRVEQSETETFQPVGNKFKVGLDLGTAYIVIVVLDEENNPIACEKQGIGSHLPLSWNPPSGKRVKEKTGRPYIRKNRQRSRAY